MNYEFKIDDHIKKVFQTDNTIYKIIDLKEVKGGNWHDGFTISLIATILSIETIVTEEFCIQYINYMCQINNVYATHIN